MQRRDNQAGFSLLEMIITLSLISLLGSIGCYGFNQLIPKYRLEGAVQNVISDFQLARMKAIGQNCFYRIQMDPEQDHYFLERESFSGTSRWPGVQEGTLRKFNRVGNPYYYPGVDLASSTNHPVFSPRGSVVGTTIVLKNSAGQKRITLSSQGRAKVQEG
ncbi:MAG: GspH/FimT family pseudopilin [Deltaproteobacteria bacterium]|nr:GspH/FimT family pseudopilin [Deltaproteobacteria bacterium]